MNQSSFPGCDSEMHIRVYNLATMKRVDKQARAHPTALSVTLKSSMRKVKYRKTGRGFEGIRLLTYSSLGCYVPSCVRV